MEPFYNFNVILFHFLLACSLAWFAFVLYWFLPLRIVIAIENVMWSLCVQTMNFAIVAHDFFGTHAISIGDNEKLDDASTMKYTK